MPARCVRRVPRERFTDAVRPRQWPYFQAVVSAVAFLGILVCVLNDLISRRDLDVVAESNLSFSSGYIWDGALCAGCCTIFLFVIQGLVNTRSRHSVHMMRLFIFVSLLLTGLVFITTLGRTFTFVVLAEVHSNSCSYFPSPHESKHLKWPVHGSCFNQCRPAVPIGKSSCCCCTNFSLSGDGIAVFTHVHGSCDNVFGKSALLLAAQMLTSSGLLIACVLLLLVQFSLHLGWCGPRLRDVIGAICMETTERASLLTTGDIPPGYNVNPSAPPVNGPVTSGTVSSNTFLTAGGSSINSNGDLQRGALAPPVMTMTAGHGHIPQQDALALDLGAPPAYQESWTRPHSNRSLSPAFLQ
ncbi:uncharacterized protein LOC135811900 [Sycon ciliatum]|uniref:uncharacterized protein LOC135811900 n=1 Tax=Sycon ciliatum TaxID=27933 RepID=UPI0020AEC04D|eukprot:scpid73140/ scgid31248/ 